MKKNEKAFLTITFIGFMLVLSLVPWGKWIMLIGIGLLANTYFFGFSALLNNKTYQEFSKNKNESKNHKAIQMLPPYSILTMMVGMLFKFEAWPGGDLILLSGVVLGAGAIYFVVKKTDQKKEIKQGALKRIVITSILAISFYSLPNFFWFDIVNREHPEYIQATKNIYSDPENEEYRSQLEVERKKMKDGV